MQQLSMAIFSSAVGLQSSNIEFKMHEISPAVFKYKLNHSRAIKLRNFVFARQLELGFLVVGNLPSCQINHSMFSLLKLATEDEHRVLERLNTKQNVSDIY